MAGPADAFGPAGAVVPTAPDAGTWPQPTAAGGGAEPAGRLQDLHLVTPPRA